MTTDLEAIGRDLQHALERRLSNKRRRSHRVRLAGLCLAATGAFATVAYASGIGGDLQLDPSKWSILGGGSVDEGRGAYVHAKNRVDGSNSTFMVEHDSGLPRLSGVPPPSKDLGRGQLHLTGARAGPSRAHSAHPTPSHGQRLWPWSR